MLTAPVIEQHETKNVLCGIHSRQALSHRQRLAYDGSELELVVQGRRRAAHNLILRRCSSDAVLAVGSLYIGPRDNNGAGTALITDGKVVERGRGAFLTGDDASGVLNMGQAA